MGKDNEVEEGVYEVKVHEDKEVHTHCHKVYENDDGRRRRELNANDIGHTDDECLHEECKDITHYFDADGTFVNKVKGEMFVRECTTAE